MKKLIVIFFLLLLLPVSTWAQWQTSVLASPHYLDATITWNSAVPSTTRVIYGTKTPPGTYSTNYTTLTSTHSVALLNLLDGVGYFFRPLGGDAVGANVTGKVYSFSTKTIVVTVSPATATLTSGQTQQFTATVTGTSDQSVTWKAALGAITSTGLYTAPSVTLQTADTVTATSVVGSKRSGTAAVTINPVVATQHSVTLNWNATSTACACTYNMLRSTIAGGYYQALASGLAGLSYQDSGVVSGATYYYVATATDPSTGLTSGYSNEAAAVIP